MEMVSLEDFLGEDFLGEDFREEDLHLLHLVQVVVAEQTLLLKCLKKCLEVVEVVDLEEGVGGRSTSDAIRVHAAAGRPGVESEGGLGGGVDSAAGGEAGRRRSARPSPAVVAAVGLADLRQPHDPVGGDSAPHRRHTAVGRSIH